MVDLLSTLYQLPLNDCTFDGYLLPYARMFRFPSLMECATPCVPLFRSKVFVILGSNCLLRMPSSLPMQESCGLSWTTRLLLWLLSKRPDIDSFQLRTQQEHLNSCWQQRSKRR